MALFLGSYANKVDRKGRVSVPAPFRTALAGQVFIGIIAFPSFKEPTIESYSEGDMSRLAESLEQLDQFSQERDDLATIFADSLQLAFDGEGRIVLPQAFADYAGITDTALFVSAVDHFQIWSPETYARKKNGARERLQSRGATLRVRPSGGSAGSGSSGGAGGGAGPAGAR
jgi:MraZ protein